MTDRSDHTWKLDGACRGEDPDIFFPTRGEDLAEARAICSFCPVFDQCHEAGLYERHGVWAGLSERERRRLRKQLGIRLVDEDLVDDDHYCDPDRPCTFCREAANATRLLEAAERKEIA